MKIVIAGGTGFLGRPLTNALLQDEHDIVILTRAIEGPPRAQATGARAVSWDPNGEAGPWAVEVGTARRPS